MSLPEDISNGCFAGSNVLVQKLGSLDAHEARSRRCHGSCHDVRLATSWWAIQQQASPQAQRCPADSKSLAAPSSMRQLNASLAALGLLDSSWTWDLVLGMCSLRSCFESLVYKASFFSGQAACASPWVIVEQTEIIGKECLKRVDAPVF